MDSNMFCRSGNLKRSPIMDPRTLYLLPKYFDEQEQIQWYLETYHFCKFCNLQIELFEHIGIDIFDFPVFVNLEISKVKLWNLLAFPSFETLCFISK